MKRKSMTIGAVAVILVLAGSNPASTSAAMPETPGQGTAAAGEPIKVVQILDVPQMNMSALGAAVAAESINAAGGVNGRPIEVVVCDDNMDINKSAECAREAIADPNVIAFVASHTNVGGTSSAAVEQAGMAAIGSTMYVESDYSSPVVFPVTGGGPVNGTARGVLCADVLGAELLGVPYVDVASAAAAAEMVRLQVTEPRGLPDPVTVAVPYTAADVSAQVAALRDTDCMAIALNTDVSSRLILTARQQGINVPAVVPGTENNPTTISAQLGEDAENVYLTTLTNHFSEGYQEMEAAVAEYRPGDTGIVTDQTAQAWLAMQVFAHVAGGVDGDLTREAVLDGMRNLSGFDTKGMTRAPLDYTVEATALGGEVPNLYPSVTGAWAIEFRDGEFVPLYDGNDMQVFGAD